MDTITYLDMTGAPFSEVTVHDLLFTIASVYSRGGGIISVRHGSDKKTKTEIRREIRKLKKSGKIKCIVFGENVGDSDDVFVYLCDRYPYLVGNAKKDTDITLISV